VGDDSANKLYVAGVSWDTSNDGLFNFFSRFGTVVNAQVQRDHLTGRSRGFGFVTFADKASCDKVLAENLSLDGRKMEIKFAIPKGQVPSIDSAPSMPGGRPKKIYIAGISVGVNEEDLKDHFSQFGKVLECYIQKDRNSGESRGFAFLTYENPDSVDKVLQRPSQKIGDKCIVDVKVARPKGEPPKDFGPVSSVGSGTGATTPMSTWGPSSGGYGGGYSSAYGGGYSGGYYGGYGGFGGSYGGVAPGYGNTNSFWGGGMESLGSSRVADGYGSAPGTGGTNYPQQTGYDQGYGYGTGGIVGTQMGGGPGYSDQSTQGYGQTQSTPPTDDTKRGGYDPSSYGGYGTQGVTPQQTNTTTGSYDPTTVQSPYGPTPTPPYDPSQYTYGAMRRAPDLTTQASPTDPSRRPVAYHPYAR